MLLIGSDHDELKQTLILAHKTGKLAWRLLQSVKFDFRSFIKPMSNARLPTLYIRNLPLGRVINWSAINTLYYQSNLVLLKRTHGDYVVIRTVETRTTTFKQAKFWQQKLIIYSFRPSPTSYIYGAKILLRPNAPAHWKDIFLCHLRLEQTSRQTSVTLRDSTKLSAALSAPNNTTFCALSNVGWSAM